MTIMEKRRQSWYVMQPLRTLGAAALFAVAVRFVYVGLIPESPTPIWVAPVAAFVAFFCLRAMVRGGCIVDYDNRRLIRWWGFFLPLYWRVIAFDQIQDVRLSCGLYPNSVRAASQVNVSHNLAVETDGNLVLIRQYARHYRQAAALGKDLADACEASFTDATGCSTL